MSKTIPNLDPAGFGKAVVTELQRRGIGSTSKRELEALLLHLLQEHSDLGNLSDHDAGLLLRAQAQRIKSLRLEAALRFEEDVERAAGDRLIAAIKAGRYDSAADMVILVVEDAFGRDALLAALKRHGGYGDWRGGNSEVIQVKSELLTKVLHACLAPEEVAVFVRTVTKGKAGPAHKAFASIMAAVFSEMKERGAGSVVDLARDAAGAHLGDLARLAPIAIEAMRQMGS